MLKNKTNKIYVAGHTGLVGSAIVRSLQSRGHNETELILRTRRELDLTNQEAVRKFFKNERPTHVYLAAAKVGGISANMNYPAEFIWQNILIAANVIEAAFSNGVNKLLFLGSSCIYPKMAKQPMQEQALLTGNLEPSNEPYAIAKIAGIKMCESYNRQYSKSHGIDFRSLMPTNLYGPNDNFHPTNSHVIPALIRRIHEAKIKDSPTVTIWGSGNQRREFLYVDDMADASIHVMGLDKETYLKHTKEMISHINVGTGTDVTIKSLAEIISDVVGFNGKLLFDASKPEGTPRKLMDNAKINSLGWKPKMPLDEGLSITYQEFLKNYGN